MTEFDESKVINALHTDKAEVGKKYWFSNSIKELLNYYAESENISILTEINDRRTHPFVDNGGAWFQFLYPYEEPAKQRMTNRQLMEWLAKGNGERKYDNAICSYWFYNSDKEYDEVIRNIRIRTWDSEEWVEPTVDIYERDCKKE